MGSLLSAIYILCTKSDISGSPGSSKIPARRHDRADFLQRLLYFISVSQIPIEIVLPSYIANV